MIIVILLANQEINARVASTCPFYYFGLSQLLVETRREVRELWKSGTGMRWWHLGVAVSVGYNLFVVGLNPLLFSNEVGFV
mmetsp:Transcript_11479/g.19425  ORF Transcript_11479/g.19425 Transcript_11479/m.19425 type:complete len:81 (+) Transcript_11479:1287-1529(+)